VGGCRENGATLFLELHSGKMTGSRNKLEHGNFWLDVKVTCFLPCKRRPQDSILGGTQNFDKQRLEYSDLTGLVLS